MALFGKVLSIVAKVVHVTSSVLFCLFAGIFVFFSVVAPPIALLRGESVAVQGHMDRVVIHE